MSSKFFAEADNISSEEDEDQKEEIKAPQNQKKAVNWAESESDDEDKRVVRT